MKKRHERTYKTF